MNFCSQLQLLLTVGAFCITASANHSWEHYLREKSCLAQTQQDRCTSGFTQEYVDLAVQCNQEIYQNLAEDCAVNARGEVCFGIAIDTISPAEDVWSACLRDSSYSPTCSPRCRRIFTHTRDRLGCCVNTFNDPELSSYAGSLRFRFDLWTLCGVELVTEQCESTINSTRTQLDPTCTEADFNQQLSFNVFCRRQFIDSTINATGADMCGISAELSSPYICPAYEDGQYCSAIPDSETWPAAQQASRACTNTSECDPLCVEALNNAIRSLGCCFISLFNDTETQPDWLTFEFWQQCDLTSPGFCESRFNYGPHDSGVSLRASTCIIIIAYTLIMFKLY